MPLHVSSTFAHHQEVKIALHSLWYHHTYRWPSRAQMHPIGVVRHQRVNKSQRHGLSLDCLSDNMCETMIDAEGLIHNKQVK